MADPSKPFNKNSNDINFGYRNSSNHKLDGDNNSSVDYKSNESSVTTKYVEKNMGDEMELGLPSNDPHSNTNANRIANQSIQVTSNVFGSKKYEINWLATCILILFNTGVNLDQLRG